MTANYPDIALIIAAKQRRRLELAALTWEEKVAIVETMRQQLPRRHWRKPDALDSTSVHGVQPAVQPPTSS